MMTRKLLIFDLDETLVHATTEPLPYPADFEWLEYFVYKRPYVNELLTQSVESMTLRSGRRRHVNMLM
ncbi:MAG TPA: NIF family HAD-type phosphatase [Pseudoduganella sp.]